MTSRQAVFGVGGALLVAYLAAANMPSEDAAPRERAPRPTGTGGTESLAAEVQSQAARLQARMAQAPVPDPNPRNPFSFGLTPRIARAARPEALIHGASIADGPPPAPLPPPLPALTLMGIAEETTASGPRRTAVIGGDGDAIYMVTEGE